MSAKTRSLWVGLLLLSLIPGLLQAQSNHLFSTRFERTEGYSTTRDLNEQNGWMESGSGGDGIVDGFFGVGSQQAYIGFSAPASNETFHSVWYPINFDPAARGRPVVTFSVQMGIFDSTNGKFDDFRWAVYNTNATRLFLLDFDNSNLRISYRLDDTNGFVFTGRSFENDREHRLVVTMDFAINRWHSTLDGAVLTTNLPITTTGTPLHFGDADAVWMVRTAGQPGNNMMVFDDYQISAEPQPQNFVLYQTGFEAVEGFEDFMLIGQGGWLGEGTGGNGIVTNQFAGLGQQAYIGYFPPTNREASLSLWQPLNYSPVPTNAKIHFSVIMSLRDSTNAHYDEFRWSVYNVAGQRLFTVSFDNSDLAILYALDNTAGFIDTGRKFQNEVTNLFTMVIDFAGNNWSAQLNGVSIAAGLPVTTTGAARNLGDIDAVWSIRDPALPGDNFMIFDQYRVEVRRASASIPPRLQILKSLDGSLRLRLEGEAARSYLVEQSFNLAGWTPLATNHSSQATRDLAIPQTGTQRFFRARLLP